MLLLPFGQWAYGESRVQNRERNAANKIRVIRVIRVQKNIRVIREIRVQKIIRVQNKIRGYGSPRYSTIALTWWAMKYLELRR